MGCTITKAQYEELLKAEEYNRDEFRSLLEEYLGIKATPHLFFSYRDESGYYIGDDDYFLDELLEAAYVKVGDD